jgi:ribosomal protein S24E
MDPFLPTGRVHNSNFVPKPVLFYWTFTQLRPRLLGDEIRRTETHRTQFSVICKRVCVALVLALEGLQTGGDDQTRDHVDWRLDRDRKSSRAFYITTQFPEHQVQCYTHIYMSPTILTLCLASENGL